MITIENETLGYYTLGFLHIKINTDADVSDLNLLIQNENKVFSTFFHEYIHFLQNFTSTNGFYSSTFYTQLIKYLVDKIKKDTNSNIQLPVSLDNNYNQKSKMKLNSIYIGSSGVVCDQVIYKSYRVTKEEIEYPQGSQLEVPKYYIDYVNIASRENDTYVFGSIALKEYVAHKIQNKFHKTAHPDIPYLLPELILDKELPQLKNYDDLKILLCDASLMHLHPAQFFFDAIEKIKKNRIFPKKPTRFYEFLFERIKFKGELGEFKNENELFNFTAQQILEDSKNIYGSDYHENEANWLLHVINEGRELRIQNPTFILQLVDDDGKFHPNFLEIVQKLGTPFYINNKAEGGYVPPRNLETNPEQVQIMLAASEVIFNAFSNKACALYDFCSTNHKDKNPTNDHCKTNPFLKLAEPEACSFTQLCKSWGIHEKNYIR